MGQYSTYKSMADYWTRFGFQHVQQFSPQIKKILTEGVFHFKNQQNTVRCSLGKTDKIDSVNSMN